MTRRAARGEGDAQPQPMLRSQHAEATRRAVLAAARSLFGRQGYAQTSVDEIADAARVTKGAVYHHFAGKEALFRAVYAEVEAEAQSRVLGAGNPEALPVDQIVAMMSAYLDAALDEEIRRITLIDGPAIVGEPDSASAEQAAQVALRSFLATAMARGQIIELDPDLLTGLVGGLAWVAGMLIARASDPDVTREALGRALDAMLRGLAQLQIGKPARPVRGCPTRIPIVCFILMESGTLETRLGSLAWQSSGRGPTLVFFAGAVANHELWRDVVTALEDRYRCITIDLPLGAHPWPLAEGADRSATSLARLLLDCLELLDTDDVTVVANDTAGGLLLLSLATGHPALGRIGRLVLTNCESYDQFPPDSLKMASTLSRAAPWLARGLFRLQLWLQSHSSAARRRGLSSVSASELDHERADLFTRPALRDWRVADDLIAAMAGFRPQLLLDASREIPRFDRPVLLIWGEACRFFPMSQARRLASDFPHATLVPVPGAKTWVPVDNPATVAGAIAGFVPAQVP